MVDNLRVSSVGTWCPDRAEFTSMMTRAERIDRTSLDPRTLYSAGKQSRNVAVLGFVRGRGN